LSSLAQPGFEQCGDLDAAARPFQSSTDEVALDHEERGNRLDVQPPDEIGSLVRVDAENPERLVVAASLEDLGDEALYAAAVSRAG
jgi:hypothetical protein